MPPEIALQYVDDCDFSGIKTIGVEAFRVVNGALQPLLDEIGDWSSAEQSDVRTINAETRAFINRFNHQADIRISISISDTRAR